MTEVSMLLDDPELNHRSPGEGFALAHARHGAKAVVELRAAISDLFPPSRRRFTVRHLLRKAENDVLLNGAGTEGIRGLSRTGPAVRRPGHFVLATLAGNEPS